MLLMLHAIMRVAAALGCVAFCKAKTESHTCHAGDAICTHCLVRKSLVAASSAARCATTAEQRDDGASG